MATRKDLSVDDDGGAELTSPSPVDESQAQDESPKPTKRLKKGWKDPSDTAARGKFKMASGNICEHM